MRSGMATYVTHVLVALLLTSVQSHAATQPGEKNVKSGQTLQWSFDRDPLGEIPKGAQAFNGKWEVRAEADAPTPPNALCQTGTAQYPLFPSRQDIRRCRDLTGFKPISGSSDRAAGIIFRIQDRDNYYILRANALEDNVNIYKYVGGRRHVVKEGSARVLSGKWQELRVEVKGNAIRGFLNGKLVVEARDDTFKAGKVGLWTKADSVTCFDNVKASAP